MVRWRELPSFRAVARGATRQRVIVAVSYILLLVSCEDALGPDSSGAVRIQTDPAALSMIVGETRTITARVIDGGGAPLNGARVFWATDNVAVATVSDFGIVSGIAPGTARISASSRGKSTIVPVTVRPRPTALVRVTPPTSTIREGEVVTLHAEPVDAVGEVVSGRPVVWTSSSEALATVSSAGVVTGVSGGRATITATVDGVSGSAVVVVESTPVATVSVTPTTGNIFVGRSLQLSATVANSLGSPLTGRSIVWVSNAPAVASVSSTGQVIGLAPGTATITAISEGKGGSSQITVALVPVATVSIIPSSATMSIGRSATLFARLLDADGEALTGRAVTWVSDQPSVVSVMPDGVITAVSIGQARITATAEGRSGTATIDVVALSVSGLTVSPNPLSLEVGRTRQLIATARDGQGNVLPGRIVSWVSGGPTIATVSETGLVTAVSPGTALIIATSERQQAIVTVTVSEVRVDQVTVTPSSVTLELGRTSQLSALIIDAAGAPIAGKIPVWTTSSPAVATVSGSGVVTAVGLGSTTIIATSDGVSGVATINVIPVPVARVSVLPSTAGITVGSTLPLTVSLHDAAGNPLSSAGRTITWTSSAPAVASVSGIGVVSAISAGTATISVQCEGVTGQSAITVSDIPVASVSVTPTSAALNPGGTVQFAATAKDANGNVLTGRLTTWSSNDATVATVSATGLVTAVAVGSTPITALVDGVLGTASVSVSLMPIASIAVSPNPATVVEGQTLTLTATASDSLGNVLSGRPIVWASGDNAVATVSQAGVVTGIAPGNVTITASAPNAGLGGTTPVGTRVVSVTFAPVASVAIVPTAPSIIIGTPTQLAATLLSASPAIPLSAVGRTLTWSVDNPAIATISANGVVTGLAAGATRVRISASSPGQVTPATNDVPLTVSLVQIARIDLTPLSGTIHVGSLYARQVIAQAFDANNNPLPGRQISWSTSDPTRLQATPALTSNGVTTITALGAPAGGLMIIASAPSASGVVADTVTISSDLVPVSSIAVAPTSATLLPSQTRLLTATASDSAGNAIGTLAGNPLAGRLATWVSGDPNVGTVNATGLVTAVAVGQTTIGVSIAGVGPATFLLSVAPVPVRSVSVFAADSSITTGTTVQATAIARDSANNVLSLTGRSVVWTSSSPAVATVSASGVVTASAPGTATIAVIVDGVGPATFVLTASPIPVASVVLSATDSSLTIGDVVQATVVARDAANNTLSLSGRSVVWTSNTPAVATISTSGVITALGLGTATIGVTVDGVGPATFTLIVAPIPVAAVSVSATDSSLTTGTTTQASVVARDAANNVLPVTGRTIVWTSSATGVATVSASGLVTAVASGSSTIGVTVDGVGPATFGLTVSPPAVASVSVTTTSSSLTVGGTAQATVVARDAANNILPLAGRSVVWTSSATGVATVSVSGLVTAVGVGTSTIGVTVDGVGPATFSLTVAPISVASVSVSAPDSSLTLGDPALQATVVARDAANNVLSLTGRTVVWSSSASSVATVSQTGVITAVGSGSTTISVIVDLVGPATFTLTVSPPSVASVSVSLPVSSLTVGMTALATVVARDAANNVLGLTGRTILWTSSAPGVATVSGTGLVTAVAAGSSTIGVTVDGVGPATFILTVLPPSVASVSVTATDSSLTVGTTAQATVVARDAANNILPLTGRTVVWTSGAPGVATVSASGLVTAIAAGSATIGVTVDGVGPASFAMSVAPAAVASVSVVATDSSLTVGTTAQATVVARDAASNILPLTGRAVVWTSSATSVATVSASGLVTAVAAGSSTIGVTVDGVGPATFLLSVTPVPVASVSVSAPVSSLTVGMTALATVVARDAANNILSLTGRTILWTSSAPGVATVSGTGLVTAVAAGSSTIGVTVDGVGPATFGLTVSPPSVALVSVTAADSSLTTGTTTQATVVARDAGSNILSLAGRTVVWTSSATSVATVSASGLVTAVSPGSSTIGVTVDGVGPATFVLTVSPGPVASVSVSAPVASLTIGTTTQATVVARDAANTVLVLTGRTILWTSSAPGVATVSASGLVTAVAAGSATIGVTVDGVGPATFQLTVTQVPVASVTVTAPDSSLTLGDPAVQATVVARDAANNILALAGRTVQWTSSAPGTATVSASGIIAAVGVGTSTIGVTVDGVGPATFVVTVAPAVVASVSVTAADSSLTSGATTQATVVARDAANNILSLAGRAVVWTSSAPGVATVSASGLVTAIAAGSSTIGVTIDGVGPATFGLTVSPPTVASVSVTAPDSSLTLGDPPMSARVVARDAANNILSLTGRTIVWTSSATGVATVSASGLISAVSPGSSTIGVTVDGVGPATFGLTVSPPSVALVSVTAPDSSLTAGTTTQATVVARDAANNILSLTGRTIVWTSSATGVATVSTSGLVTAIGAGTSTIGVSVDGVGPATFGLTVTPPSVASVSVTAPDSSLTAGTTTQATVVARDAANNILSLTGRTIVWTSSAPGVATVSASGLVTAVAAGSATIGVSVDGVGPATFLLTVTPVSVASVSVSAPDSSLTAGTTTQATVVARDAANNILSLTGRTIVWTSSATGVATVSASGLVTAVAAGSSTISVAVDGVGPATFGLTVTPPLVATVSVSAPDSSLTTGTTTQATVVARDAANNILSLTGRTIVWTSSATGVATVSASGLITAVSPGSSTIGVTVDGVGPASFAMNVTPAAVASVSVSAPDSNLTTGTTTQATVVARDAANNTLSLTGRTIVWTSSATGVATVSASGLVTAVGAGSSTIGVTVDGVGPASFAMNVTPPAVASVSVSAPDSSLTSGSTTQATVVARDAANNILPLTGRTVVWSSSATGVATVSASGLVTAVGAGSSTIGVTVDGIGPATFLLTVTPVPVASVTVTAPDSNLVEGTTTQATVVARDAANNILALTGRTIVWTSSATGVATVSASGLISAVSPGSGTIGVTVDGVGPATFLLTVTPVPVASVSVTAPDSSIALGDPALQATVVARDAANNILPLTGRTVVWSSSDASVATVSASGLITPAGAGTSTIGVTVDGIGPATFVLTVASSEESLTGPLPNSSLTTGSTTQAAVVARHAANNVLSLSGRTMVWTSSAPDIATVSASAVSVRAADSSIALGDGTRSGDRRGPR